MAVETIVCITTKSIWQDALKVGAYNNSTITSSLEEVGFIHATKPDQTIDVLPRFDDQQDVILLLIDANKLKPELKYEAARSGRAGLFPHIYGPLNVDAVYDVIEVNKDEGGKFLAPEI